jgi:ankyrin repeat protein
MNSRENPQVLTIKLVMAIQNHKLDDIKKLIAEGADLAIINDEMTPMEYATSLKAWDCVTTIASCKKTDKADAYRYHQALIAACNDNKDDVIIALLKAGTNANTALEGYASLSHWAVTMRKNKILQLLIECGADLAVTDSKGHTPIAFAGINHCWDGVETIAKAKRADARGTYLYSHALMFAITLNRITTVECLLNAGVKPVDQYQTTLDKPLHEAVKNGNAAMITLLLEHGADITGANAAKQTPMQLAATLNKWGCVETMAKAKKTDAADKAGYADALTAAALVDRIETVNIMLAAGTPVTTKASQILLFSAIRRNDTAMLKQLIANGSDLAAVNDNKQTAMEYALWLDNWQCIATIAKAKHTDPADSYHYAAALKKAVKNDDYDSVKCLLEAGALNNHNKDSELKCILHSAIQHSRWTKSITLLIHHGADLSAQDNYGNTPIMYAANTGNWSTMEAIAKCKPTDIKDTYHYGQAALHALQKDRSRATLKILITAGACNNPIRAGELFILAVKLDKLEIAADLAAPKAWVNHQDLTTGDSPLHIAVHKNNLTTLRFVLEQQANQAIANRSNKTPIELAAEAGYWDCVQLLLEFDRNNGNDKKLIADLHLEQTLLIAIKKSNYAIAKLLLEHHAPFDKWNSELGNIALYWAVKNNEKNPEMVTLLLDHGADSSIRNKDGKTIVEVARDLRHNACVTHIKKHADKVKLDRSAAEYRREVKQLFQSMHDNAVKPADMPGMLTKLREYSRALLTSNLAILTKRRDDLMAGITVKANTEQSLIDIFDPTNEEEKISSLIRATHTLLNFPNSVSPQFIARAEDKVEANDVSEFLRQKTMIDQYADHIKRELNSLQFDINHEKWQVKFPLGGWVPGYPKHIKLILAELNKLPAAQTLDELLAIYVEVLTIMADIDQSPKRHPGTTNFYSSHAKIIQSITLAPPPALSGTTPLPSQSFIRRETLQPLAPARAATVYPSLKALQGGEVQLSAHFFQRAPEAAPPPYSSVDPTKQVSGDLIALDTAQPAKELVLPNLPQRPATRRNSDFYQSADESTENVEKKSEGKKLVMG